MLTIDMNIVYDWFDSDNPYKDLLYLDEKDKEITMLFVQRDGNNLEFAPPVLQDDEDVVTAAVKQTPGARVFASRRLQEKLASNETRNKN